jgi:hypothetical protein
LELILKLLEFSKAVREADRLGLIAESKSSKMFQGYSGKKLIGALQRLSTLFSVNENVCYLEVGVFQGLTLLSVASACSQLPCYGIDNFAYFDPYNRNKGIVLGRMAQAGIENAKLIDMDYEDALEQLAHHIGGKKVGVYFVDGPHDYRSQLMCLELALPYLHEEAVIVVDDSNYRHVRQANRDFLITHSRYKLLFETYTRCHPNNMHAEEVAESREGWWNGVNIIVSDPSNVLAPMYPETERSRMLYENEHVIHSSNIAAVTPQALAFIQSLYAVKPIRALTSLYRLVRAIMKQKDCALLYRDLNTYSDKLTTRLNMPNIPK